MNHEKQPTFAFCPARNFVVVTKVAKIAPHDVEVIDPLQPSITAIHYSHPLQPSITKSISHPSSLLLNTLERRLQA
jgi:hypothetical protein